MAPRSSSASGRRCARFPPARRRATPRSPGRSAGRPGERSPRPARRIRWPSRSLVIASSGGTATHRLSLGGRTQAGASGAGGAVSEDGSPPSPLPRAGEGANLLPLAGEGGKGRARVPAPTRRSRGLTGRARDRTRHVWLRGRAEASEPEECRRLAGLYGEEARFRTRVVMAAHGFGRGEIQIFRRPVAAAGGRATSRALSAPGAGRRSLERGDGHRRLLSVRARGVPRALPRAGQTRPTPLLLRYGPGDYNCLHQDLYGEHSFRCRSRFCSPSRA